MNLESSVSRDCVNHSQELDHNKTTKAALEGRLSFCEVPH